MEIRPTYPIFLEDVTVNRHIFFWALGKFSLIIIKHGPLLIYLGLENGLMPCTSLGQKKNMTVYGYPTDPIFSGDPSSFYR